MSMVAVDDALWESVPTDGTLWLAGPARKPSRWFYLLGDSREGPACRITVRRLGPALTELRVDVLAVADAEPQDVLERTSAIGQDITTRFLVHLARHLTEAGAAMPARQRTPAKTPPPVTDPTDQRILAWVTEDPHLTDRDIAQRLGIHRQPVNERRRRLQAMGYKVR
jgi:hypothetical protein